MNYLHFRCILFQKKAEEELKKVNEKIGKTQKQLEEITPKYDAQQKQEEECTRQ